MTSWGIDISNHQRGANLAKAKAAGCSFVFVKATEGLTYTDPEYADFRAKAGAAGLPLGAYHFARPQAGRTGAQEAAHFLSVHRQQPGDLPPVLDLESTALSSSATVAFALDWLTTVHKATGVRPIVYTYSAFAAQHLGGGKALAAYPLWLANYRSTPPPAPAPWSTWVAWQHTSSATVPGIPGSCDRNIAAPGFPTTTTTAQEDDMPLTEADAKTIWRSDIIPSPDGSDVWQADSYLQKILAETRALRAAVAAQSPAAIAAAVKAALPATADVDVDALAKAIVLELGKDS